MGASVDACGHMQVLQYPPHVHHMHKLSTKWTNTEHQAHVIGRANNKASQLRIRSLTSFDNEKWDVTSR